MLSKLIGVYGVIGGVSGLVHHNNLTLSKERLVGNLDPSIKYPFYRFYAAYSASTVAILWPWVGFMNLKRMTSKCLDWTCPDHSYLSEYPIEYVSYEKTKRMFIAYRIACDLYNEAPLRVNGIHKWN